MKASMADALEKWPTGTTLRGPVEVSVPGPKPLLQAFLLADHVYVDHLTGKAIVAGVFFRLLTPEVPTDFGGCWAYACLKEVPVTFTVQLRLIDLKTHETIAESQVLNSRHDAGRLEPHQIMLPIPPIRFMHEGAYDFELVIDGETLKGWRFTVEIPKSEGTQNA